MTSLLSWHRVGQRIVCVEQQVKRNAPSVVVGQVYTIMQVGQWQGIVLFALEEMPPFPKGRDYRVVPEWLWDATYFQPVKETSIESFRSLLNPTPEQARELEDA